MNIDLAESCYEGYVSKLHPSLHHYLEKELDWDAGGVDRDLSTIGRQIPDWEEELAESLGLTTPNILDIHAKHDKKLKLQG